MKFKVGDIVKVSDEGVNNKLDGCHEADEDYTSINIYTGYTMIGEVVGAFEETVDTFEGYTVKFGEDSSGYLEMELEEFEPDELDLVDNLIYQVESKGTWFNWFKQHNPNVYQKMMAQI